MKIKWEYRRIGWLITDMYPFTVWSSMPLWVRQIQDRIKFL